MLKKTKFFDVECAYGRAYDLKELRRILDKVIKEKVRRLQVVRMGRHTVRAIVELHDHTEVDFKGIQHDVLNDRGVVLIEVAADGVGKSMQIDPEAVGPSVIPVNIVPVSAVPVTIEMVKQHPAVKRSRRQTQPSRSRSAAA